MKDYAQELYAFVQERYLWQFHSRSWDREANINGVTKITMQLLTSDVVSLETPAEKCFYVDAKTFANDIKKRFPGFLELDLETMHAAMNCVKEKLLDVMVEKSLNGELRNPNY